MSARLIIGDVFDALATLEPASVDLVLTSPPFLALRSYLPPGHPDKAKEIGSEATPGEFIDTLLDVVEACARVLAPHGSLVFELGDTFSGSGGAGGDYNDGGLRDGQERFDGSASRAYGTGAAPRPRRSNRRDGKPVAPPGPHSAGGGSGWPLDKSLCCIPALFETALAYGLNPLTGRKTDRWRVRNMVVWPRPNPPVGALGDKFRPATSYLTVACKARDRWFDLDAVRTPHKEGPPSEATAISRRRALNRNAPGNHTEDAERGIEGNPAGAPPLDYWVIPTQPYPGAHYATWPEALCVTPILSMCPAFVCRECGQPRRRIVEKTPAYQAFRVRQLDRIAAGGNTERDVAITPTGFTNAGSAMNAEYTTLGWTDCGHDSFRPGVTLDPFAGSGTTLQVATRLGRDAIGVDLDDRNEALVRQRVGLFYDGAEYLSTERVS